MTPPSRAQRRQERERELKKAGGIGAHQQHLQANEHMMQQLRQLTAASLASQAGTDALAQDQTGWHTLLA